MKNLSFALLAVSAAVFYTCGHPDTGRWLGIASVAVLIFGGDKK